MSSPITLATLALTCVADSQLSVAAYDSFQVLTGKAHDNRLHAPKQRYGLTGGSANLRGGRGLTEYCWEERIANLLVNASPYVIEARCNVPVYLRPDVSDEIPFVIDRLLAVETLKWLGHVHFHAVLMTPEKYAQAMTLCGSASITCELFDVGEVDATDIENAEFCKRLVRNRTLTDLREEATVFAAAVRESERRRLRYLRALQQQGATPVYRTPSLDRLIERLSKQFEISSEDGYAWFGAAVMLGKLTLAPGHKLVPEWPLCLAPKRGGSR